MSRSAAVASLVWGLESVSSRPTWVGVRGAGCPDRYRAEAAVAQQSDGMARSIVGGSDPNRALQLIRSAACRTRAGFRTGRAVPAPDLGHRGPSARHSAAQALHERSDAPARKNTQEPNSGTGERHWPAHFRSRAARARADNRGAQPRTLAPPVTRLLPPTFAGRVELRSIIEITDNDQQPRRRRDACFCVGEKHIGAARCAPAPVPTFRLCRIQPSSASFRLLNGKSVESVG
jgi:hypothetical protein